MIAVIIFLIIFVYIITHAVFGALCEGCHFPLLLTPKILYNKLKINWFGAVGLYIIYLITCPIFFIGSLGAIGRK